MMRVLVPARLRKAVRAWFDSRYISIADHRQDIRDALWEVQTLRREVAALQGEVARLRNARPAATADKARIDDTYRLAQETAKALDGVLQNEVLVWQAIDDLRARHGAAGDGDLRVGHVAAGDGDPRARHVAAGHGDPRAGHGAAGAPEPGERPCA